MATIDIQIGADADNISEDADGDAYWSNPTSNIDATNEWIGVRFLGITIPAGATVTAAYLTFYFPSSSSDEPDLTIYGEDGATPAQFTQGADTYTVSGRTKTTAAVNWGSADLGAPGTYNSADISTIVQELVNSYAPYSDGAMLFCLTSRANDTARDCSVNTFAGGAANAPAIHIEYTAPVTGNPWYSYAQM
jgi:hypothetical protein